jgi:stage V sporulation protein S
MLLKVKSNTNPSDTAGAIAGLINDGTPVEIQCIGASAVNQTVKAIAIARGFLAPVGIELVCIPSFVDVYLSGEQRTAIRFTVEPRYLRGTKKAEPGEGPWGTTR